MSMLPQSGPDSAVLERDHPQVIYLSSPLSTYETRRYGAMLGHCRRLFRGAEILEPKFLFDSSADWREKWPCTLAGLGQLVFFHDGQPDWIGAGVLREIHDAFALGKPIWHLDDAGQLHPFEAVRLEVAANGTMPKLARVRLLDR